MRRAAVSVVLNVVEGYRRTTTKDYLHFLNIAQGSLVELEAALELSLDLEFMSQEQYTLVEEKRKEVGYLLYQLIKSLTK